MSRYLLLFSLLCWLGLWTLAYSDHVILGNLNPLLATALFILGMFSFIWSNFLEIEND